MDDDDEKKIEIKEEYSTKLKVSNMDDDGKNEIKEKYSTTVKVSEPIEKNLSIVSILKIIGPVLIKICLVFAILLLVLGIVMFLVSMPGFAMEELKQAFNKIGNTIAAFYGADTNSKMQA